MKKLRRKKVGKMLGGVCAGLADYFGVDVSLIRLVMVLLALAEGAGIIFYILAWIIIPVEGSEQEEVAENHEQEDEKIRILGGILFLILGVVFFMRNFVGFPTFSKIWPLFLIVIGIWMLIRSGSKKRESDNDKGGGVK
ncbi:MAG TPA: PspC domain-containing protein [Candidatus Hydrothermia bacterium]|nr:PspC domain-containing protein [Candidatus Hydrothermia bacterium]HOL24083.1 PspC domain-containing protein [Candidatus Hydrothermia bacterium]HOP33043.1 PspC domain-containing protein [Candidatus Hydrothermia bacterium]HPO78983.1 PspC domain-containing protein [Candidatus Hydrothermia bacterium]